MKNKNEPYTKRVTVYEYHCPYCHKRLTGDGSVVFPFKCKCGVWERKLEDNNKWELIKNDNE